MLPAVPDYDEGENKRKPSDKKSKVSRKLRFDIPDSPEERKSSTKISSAAKRSRVEKKQREPLPLSTATQPPEDIDFSFDDEDPGPTASPQTSPITSDDRRRLMRQINGEDSSEASETERDASTPPPPRTLTEPPVSPSRTGAKPAPNPLPVVPIQIDGDIVDLSEDDIKLLESSSSSSSGALVSTAPSKELAYFDDPQTVLGIQRSVKDAYRRLHKREFEVISLLSSLGIGHMLSEDVLPRLFTRRSKDGKGYDSGWELTINDNHVGPYATLYQPPPGVWCGATFVGAAGLSLPWDELKLVMTTLPSAAWQERLVGIKCSVRIMIKISDMTCLSESPYAFRMAAYFTRVMEAYAMCDLKKKWEEKKWVNNLTLPSGFDPEYDLTEPPESKRAWRHSDAIFVSHKFIRRIPTYIMTDKKSKEKYDRDMAKRAEITKALESDKDKAKTFVELVQAGYEIVLPRVAIMGYDPTLKKTGLRWASAKELLVGPVLAQFTTCYPAICLEATFGHKNNLANFHLELGTIVVGEWSLELALLNAAKERGFIAVIEHAPDGLQTYDSIQAKCIEFQKRYAIKHSPGASEGCVED